ncbi:MAG TPA: hypothetical protein VK821_15645 [Dehalococcoidia bacterium]|nr:hypothetical protein [Dehalococcoidia bacterium]
MSSIDLAPQARPAAVGARPFALRLPLLTLPAVGVALLVVLVIAQAVHGFTDPDFWWHYKTGEYILAQRSLPGVDIFSFPSAGRAWVAHEWLAETLIYALVRSGGYGLSLVVFASSPIFAIVLLYRLQKQEGVAANVALAVTALAALMIAPFTTVRPQVLSWAFFAVLVYVLFAYRAGRINHLWALPAFFAVWANLHLSFVLGLGMFSLFVLSQAGTQWLATRRISVAQPLFVLLASALATCINPDGPRLLLTPLSYLPLQSSFIAPMGLAEWRAPDFHNYLFLPLLGGLMLLLTTGVLDRRHDLWPAGLGVVTAALALLSVRYIPIFAIAFAPAAGLALAARWSRARNRGVAETAPNRAVVHWGLIAIVLACLAVAVRPTPGSQLRREPRANPEFLPVDSVSYIQQNYPNAHIFNQYEWGGYLIYRLWPQNRPFIDGRGEMFAIPFLKDYVRVFAVQPGWQQTLQRYDVDLVIVRNDTSLAGALESSPTWRLAHRDTVSVVYARAEQGPQTMTTRHQSWQ